MDATEPDRVVFLGDLGHWIGRPEWAELDELEALVTAVTDRVPALLVPGNHDGEVEDALSIPVTDSRGVRIGEAGFVHGHTWPSAEVLAADVVCVGHEHPTVRLEDAVGGRRIERAWLRGRLAGEAFAEHLEAGDGEPGEDPEALAESIDGELVVFPAFNELVGGTWVNVEGQAFLAPFLPEGLEGGEAFLLDGTRLGDYRSI
jgi:metallophosphoesterase superfamily enzyme